MTSLRPPESERLRAIRQATEHLIGELETFRLHLEDVLHSRRMKTDSILREQSDFARLRDSMIAIDAKLAKWFVATQPFCQGTHPIITRDINPDECEICQASPYAKVQETEEAATVPYCRKHWFEYANAAGDATLYAVTFPTGVAKIPRGSCITVKTVVKGKPIHNP
jgi:hypothetical protein